MKKIAFLLSFFSICYISAQFKFGKISDEERTYEICDFEKEAKAIILSEKGYGSLAGDLFTVKVQRRIKVLKDEDINSFAIIEIPFYSDDAMELLTIDKAQTVNIENDKEVVTKLENDQIFTKNLNKYWSSKTFTFPNVKKGSYLEYSYTITTKNLYNLIDWEFQHNIPTLKSLYTVKMQAGLSYNVLMRGNELVNKYGKQKLTSEWELHNLPSFHNIKHVYNPEKSSNAVIFQLKSYMTHQNHAALSEEKLIGEKWSQITSELQQSYDKFIYKAQIRELVENNPIQGTTEEEKLKQLVDIFNANFRWNGYQSKHTTNAMSEVVKNKSGFSSELNIIFSEMAKMYGLQSTLCLVSTRNNGMVFKNFPSNSQFSTVINLISFTSGSFLFLDAIDVNNQNLGYLPLQDCNYHGLLIKPKPDWIMISQPISTLSIFEQYVFGKEKITHESVVKMKGYVTDKIADEFAPFLAQNTAFMVNEETSKPNLIRYKKYQEYALDEKIIEFKNPLVDYISQYDFSESFRESMYEFNYPIQINLSYQLLNTEKYSLEETESTFNFESSIAELAISYSQNITQKDGKITIKYSFVFPVSLVNPDFRVKLHSFFTEISKKINTPIYFIKR